MVNGCFFLTVCFIAHCMQTQSSHCWYWVDVNLVGDVEVSFVKQPLKQVWRGVGFKASSPDGASVDELMMSYSVWRRNVVDCVSYVVIQLLYTSSSSSSSSSFPSRRIESVRNRIKLFRSQGPDFRKILWRTYEKLMKKSDLQKRRTKLCKTCEKLTTTLQVSYENV